MRIIIQAFVQFVINIVIVIFIIINKSNKNAVDDITISSIANPRG